MPILTLIVDESIYQIPSLKEGFNAICFSQFTIPNLNAKQSKSGVPNYIELFLNE